jgi:hypothetical protein
MLKEDERPPYHNQRMGFCIVMILLTIYAFYRRLYKEGIIIGLIAATSIWYHTTIDDRAKIVDMTAIAITTPIFLALSLMHGNYVAILFGSVSALVFLENRHDRCWIKHFWGVNVPAAIGYGSMVFLH